MDAPFDISPSDRDQIIRTVYGEAVGEPANGQAAVVWNILNRLRSGQFPSTTAAGIVHERNQYTSWQSPGKDNIPNGDLSPQNPDYQRIGRIVDGVVSGRIPDNTGGALNYADVPNITSSTFPATNPTVKIGRHTFFNPMKVAGGGSIFGNDFDAPASTQPAAAAPVQGGSIFGNDFDAAPAPAAKPAETAPPVPVPGYDYPALEPRPQPFQPSILDPTRLGPLIGRSLLENTRAAASSGLQTYQGGLSDIASSMTARGLGNIGLGALGMVASPLTGAFNTFGSGITQLTGNPEIGERSALLAGLMLPTKVAPTARGIAQTAGRSNALTDIVNQVGPENVPQLVSDLRANPQLRIIDKAPVVQNTAQGLLGPGQPEASRALTESVAANQRALPGMVNEAYTAALGPRPDMLQVKATLMARAQQVGQQQIAPALKGAGPVDTSDVVAAIDKELNPGIQQFAKSGLPLSRTQQELQRFRDQLVTDTGETLTDPTRLHWLQSDLRSRAQNLISSASGDDRNLGRDLMKVRNNLVDAIDAASNGKYKPTLANYRDASNIQDAFTEGFGGRVFQNRVGEEEDLPEVFAKHFNDLSNDEKLAMQAGTRLYIDQRMGSVRNSWLQGRNIESIPYNRQKLETVLGPQEAARLTRAMDDASAQAAANAKIVAGSKTAETLAAQRAMEIPQVEPFRLRGLGQSLLPAAAAEYVSQSAGLPGLGAAGGLAATTLGGALTKGAQVMRANMAARRNIEFARAVSATGPARESVLDALMSHPAVVRASQKASNALALPGQGNP